MFGVALSSTIGQSLAASASCTSLPPTVCPSMTTQTFQVDDFSTFQVGYCPNGYYPSGSTFLNPSNYLRYFNVVCLPRIPVGSKCDIRAEFSPYTGLDHGLDGCQVGAVCWNNSYVDPTTLSVTSGTCTLPGFAGDSCSANSDCFPPRICSNGYCAIPESRRNAPCSINYIDYPSSTPPCPLDQFCYLGNCTDYVPLGGSCSLDKKCNPTQGYCSDKNICISYLSLDNGQSTSSSVLCKSGFSLYNKTSSTSVCDNPPTDFSFLNKSCTSDSDCTKYGTCQCDQKANSAGNYSRCVLNSDYTWNTEAIDGLKAVETKCETSSSLECVKRVAPPAYVDLRCSEAKREALAQDSCFRIIDSEPYQRLCSSSNSNSDHDRIAIGVGAAVAVLLVIIVGVVLYARIKKHQRKNETLLDQSGYVQQ